MIQSVRKLSIGGFWFWSNLQRALGRRVEQQQPHLSLIEEDNLTRIAEAKVCYAAIDLDLGDEAAGRIPDVKPITAARIDIGIRVALDAVRDAAVGHGKDAAVAEEV